MLKKLLISILIVVLLAFTTFGQSISLGDRRVSEESKGTTAQRTAVNTVSVGQLTTKMDNITETKAVSANPSPEEIRADLIEEAGRALVSFRNNYYLGFLITVGGYVLILVGTFTYPPNAGLTTLGSIATLVGVVWQFFAYNSIGVAGDKLQRAVR